MKSKNKVSEHFPLWREAGGGFSSTESIITKSNFHVTPTSEGRSKKLEIKINAIIGAPHPTSNIQNSTFIPFITHYLLP
ncbi:MAG: hypothetical protein WAT40_05560, partial [Saprospiraceae bacterium]